MSGPPRTPPNEMEKERLAKALRDNLKRRKAQARGRASEVSARAEDGASTPDESGKD